MTYYSQFGEDQWLAENTDLPEKGFFVDVGAADPERLSNTKYFEDKGWDGICIDADPLHYKDLSEKRKNAFYAAVRSFDGITPFWVSENPDYSRTTGEIYKGKFVHVPCFRLDTILRDYRVRRIDVLSIDTEGSETEVLESLSIEYYKPKAIIIEFNTIGLPSTLPQIMEFFKDKPYHKVLQTQANVIFYRQ